MFYKSQVTTAVDLATNPAALISFPIVCYVLNLNKTGLYFKIVFL